MHPGHKERLSPAAAQPVCCAPKVIAAPVLPRSQWPLCSWGHSGPASSSVLDWRHPEGTSLAGPFLSFCPVPHKPLLILVLPHSPYLLYQAGDPQENDFPASLLEGTCTDLPKAMQGPAWSKLLCPGARFQEQALY